MPLIKSRKKKAMSENIKTEMDAGKPQKQAVAIAYSVMRRAKKNKKAQGGLSEPQDEQKEQGSLMDHFPTYDNREQSGPEGFDESQRRVSKDRRNSSNSNMKSLQEHISDKPSDEEDRSLTLFDGEAERKDPLQLEMRENESSDHLGRRDLDDEDQDADDIVSRIMRKMRRK